MQNSTGNNHQASLEQTLAWFNKAVLGLNLCPFTHAPAKSNTIRWVELEGSSPAHLLDIFIEEIERLTTTDEQSLATTVLIAVDGYADFDDYLDALGFLNAWLEETNNHQDFQLASFHPNYQFEGLTPDARANWTNRSPLPLFHIIREQSVSRALDAGADGEAIAERNVRTIEAMTETAMREIFPHFEG